MTDLDDWLVRDALPLWWRKGADHVGGGFHEVLDDAAAAPRVPRRARVIGRQIWVYASACQAELAGPWRDAAEHGLEFMISRQLRADGLIRSRVGPGGEALGDDVRLYDQAFALLALAAATGAAIAPDAQIARAGKLLEVLEAGWRGPAGGFVEHEHQAWQSNPHMHLLEAALAWEAVGGGARWAALADEISELALARFIDPEHGYLREFFDAGWRPAPGEAGRRVEPGHQFEWAWLLTRWAALRGREDAALAARRLYEIGRDHGLDARRGVAIDALNDDLGILDARARLWPQTERIKAAAILGEAEEVTAAAQGLALYFQTPIAGLWRDKMLQSGDFIDEPAPASSLYHIACALWDAKARGFAI